MSGGHPPFGPLTRKYFWGLEWVAATPDVTVYVCGILGKLPTADKNHSNAILGRAFTKQTAVAIENSGRKNGRIAEYVARVENRSMFMRVW